MTSKERVAFFSERFGGPLGKAMNLELERKLLLKNQQEAMVSWAEKMLAGEKQAPVRKDFIQRIMDTKDLLSPEKESDFLAELVGHKLGTEVSREEAQNIADLAEDVQQKKDAMDAGGDRMPYGRAVYDLHEYVSDLSNEAKKLTWEGAKAHPKEAIKRVLMETGGFSKSIKAAFDNSALFRQGWKPL